VAPDCVVGTRMALPLSLQARTLMLDWFSFVILALATYRITRLLTRDVITEGFRNWWWSKFPPIKGLGYLLTCEWCLSIWVASLFVGFAMITTVTIAVASVFALSAVAGLLTAYEDK
jgi:hypothetical protein